MFRRSQAPDGCTLPLHRRAHTLALGSVLVLALAFSGCSRAPRRKVISGIPQLAPQEIFLTERAGMEEAASKLNIDIDWSGPSDSDPQREVDILASATSSHRYGIVINPVASNASDSAVQTALSKGIPIVVARDPIALPVQPHLSFVLEDYASGAALIAQRLKQVIGGKGDVAILGLDPYSASSVSRLDALENALRHTCPDVHVVDRVIAPYSSGYVQIATERALEQHPNISALIALNNRAGLGAAAAMEEAAPNKKIRLLVFDQSLPLMLRLRRGEVDSIVAQNMRRMGKLAVQNIDADRKGKAYAHIVRLAPMLVTQANIDDDATQQALLLNWEPQ